MTLKRSKDRKVANSVSRNGKTATIANAFGLPAGNAFSCPGATTFCDNVCYANRLEKVYTGVRNVLTHNFDALRNASYAEMVVMLGNMVREFEAECDKKGADKLFRIHWDGDFFSLSYALAWRAVIRYSPDTRFWVYTRVSNAALMLHLSKLDNLSLYFSADPDNIDTARELEKQGINIAYVDMTFADGKAQFPNAVRCPENNKAIELISDKGSACVRCGLCIRGNRNVLFSVSKS